jgi:Ca-activated chloride channel family protein
MQSRVGLFTVVIATVVMAACHSTPAPKLPSMPPAAAAQAAPDRNGEAFPPAPPPPPETAPAGSVGGVAGGVVSGLEAAPPVNFAAAQMPRLFAPGPAGGGGFNTEAYDRVVDNGWKLVANDPLSTFAADVDTASYTNVRRYLNSGRLPPPDAVRIEEFINYFSFDYPEPAGERPFSVTTELGPCPWAPRHTLLLVGLQGKHIEARQIPPRNLVFLIDVSGSMAHPLKLPLVKSSLAMLTENLTGRDRVAIVVYAGASGLVLPSTAGSDRSRILSALADLQAGGSTNGVAGIQLAYQEALGHFIPGGVNRVILATDGDFNVGVTDRGSLLRLIEEKRRVGVALSVLGYGMGNYKDATLEQLADSGNGNYAYIDSLSEARKVLVTEAGGTLVTIADDVKLQVEFNPRHVAAFRLIGYENRVLAHQDFKDDSKDAGEIGLGHTVTALYELVPADAPLPVIAPLDPLRYQRAREGERSSPEWLTVRLRYKQPGAAVSTPFDVGVVPHRLERLDANLGFAAAVAALGMVLRGSEDRGSATYQLALDLARQYRGEDRHGHRAELIRLTELAAAIPVRD